MVTKTESSPQAMDPLARAVLRQARIAGVLYAAVIATAFFAEFYARGSTIVAADPAATATNILASETLYRLGGVADLVNLICDIGVAVVLYQIFAPVSRSLSLYAALMRVAADICLAVATFFHFAPLLFLRRAPYLAALALPQRQVLAYECLRLHDLGYEISLVFFAVGLLTLAGLIFRSALLPRTIGGLLLVTGVCYLTNSVLRLVAPQLEVSVWLLVPGLLSEIAMAGWLLVRGVDQAR